MCRAICWLRESDNARRVLASYVKVVGVLRNMRTIWNTAANSERRVVHFGALLAFVATVMICFASAPPAWAQAAPQVSSANAPTFEYEVATIKTYKPGSAEAGGGMRVGVSNAPDGFTASGVTMLMLVQFAYGVQPFQISGGPDWVTSERFDVDAKMDSAVADALQKMNQDDRTLTRQKMLQALLADRFKLTVQHDTKELPIYTLIVGKNGTKLKEVSPDAAAAAVAPTPGRGVRGGPGSIFVGFDSGSLTLNGTAVPIVAVVRTLSQSLRRTVVDKTGLTGRYDITLKWSPEDNGGGPAPGFAGPPAGGAPTGPVVGGAPPESSGPTLLVAVQEQLGLKLESGKGPVDMIVISHVEKVSDN